MTKHDRKAEKSMTYLLNLDYNKHNEPTHLARNLSSCIDSIIYYPPPYERHYQKAHIGNMRNAMIQIPRVIRFTNIDRHEAATCDNSPPWINRQIKTSKN